MKEVLAKPELTAPGGTLEKLTWAAHYRADCVYFGTEFGSLRAYAGNLTLDEAANGLDFLHKNRKKGFVTLNIYPFTNEYKKLIDIAGKLKEIGADALIVADMGLIFELKKAGINIPIHVSTQANTTSSQTVLAYRQLGVARVNLARELSFEQIKQIRKDTKDSGVELEVFIHGAVCFSYSGRCAISDYLTGRRANRGECTHPCRWGYSLVEESRPGEFIPVFEDERGQYLFNSKDLALFEYVEQLKEIGIDSFKIEGRMKSVHYIASIVSLYRQLLDGKKISPDECLKLLSRVKNRGYTTGFMKGSITPDDYSTKKSQPKSAAVFVGDIVDEQIEAGSVCHVRNKIFAGEKLEVLTPTGEISEITMPSPLKTADGQQLEYANNPQKIIAGQKLPAYAILRRII
ncbi:MAG: putative protease YhbU precursor [Planctomycetes bacterium ADurb.Bin401]|nr:MAG: putative protease YhbU precursor [Planctomycetes bacterium ADurb.Bin401]